MLRLCWVNVCYCHIKGFTDRQFDNPTTSSITNGKDNSLVAMRRGTNEEDTQAIIKFNIARHCLKKENITFIILRSGDQLKSLQRI